MQRNAIAPNATANADGGNLGDSLQGKQIVVIIHRMLIRPRMPQAPAATMAATVMTKATTTTTIVPAVLASGYAKDRCLSASHAKSCAKKTLFWFVSSRDFSLFPVILLHTCETIVYSNRCAMNVEKKSKRGRFIDTRRIVHYCSAITVFSPYDMVNSYATHSEVLVRVCTAFVFVALNFGPSAPFSPSESGQSCTD